MNNIQSSHDVWYLAEIGRASLGLFHDILNPIGSLTLYLEYMERQKLLSHTAVPHIKRLRRSSKHIHKFVKTIQHDISDQEATSINVHEVVRHVIYITSHRALMRNVSIAYIGKRHCYVTQKKIRIYQILLNVVSNAIDAFESIHDNRKRRVSITIELLHAHIKITVTDNGCGMTPETIQRIFEKFYSTKKYGLGIGLYHTKQIVQNELAGTITINSVVGNGTTCTITIPKNH